MKNIHRYVIIFICLIPFFIYGCEREKAKQVSLSEEKIIPTPPEDKNVLKVAISAIISPKKTFIYYKDMLDYISEKTGVPIKLIQRDTYAEVNKLIEEEKVDVAFVCSGAYVEGHDKFDMELLVAPKVNGEPYYYSYIIVPVGSTAQKFEDLRGKVFAFSDPMSNSGKLVPTYMLAEMGETPSSFFSKTIFTYSHDKSIEAVAQNLVDGAAVDSLIWDYTNIKTPNLTSKTKIIKKSAPFGIPPVVVAKGLNSRSKELLKKLFLNMHADEKSKKILTELNIDSFVEVDDSFYASVREMQNKIKE